MEEKGKEGKNYEKNYQQAKQKKKKESMSTLLYTIKTLLVMKDC